MVERSGRDAKVLSTMHIEGWRVRRAGRAYLPEKPHRLGSARPFVVGAWQTHERSAGEPLGAKATDGEASIAHRAAELAATHARPSIVRSQEGSATEAIAMPWRTLSEARCLDPRINLIDLRLT